jgi:RNA polymerase sigma-70 factor (ECF subfamily)
VRDEVLAQQRGEAGGAAGAQDLLEEAWLRWHRVDPATVEDPGVYLYRLVTRQAIDHLRRGPPR